AGKSHIASTGGNASEEITNRFAEPLRSVFLSFSFASLPFLAAHRGQEIARLSLITFSILSGTFLRGGRYGFQVMTVAGVCWPAFCSSASLQMRSCLAMVGHRSREVSSAGILAMLLPVRCKSPDQLYGIFL